MFSMKEFGQRVSNLRKVRNLTQDELAYRVNVNKVQKECDTIDPTENRPSLPPQRKSQSRAKAALLPAPREDP